jgi:hypothetical protein
MKRVAFLYPRGETGNSFRVSFYTTPAEDLGRIIATRGIAKVKRQYTSPNTIRTFLGYVVRSRL